MKISNKHREIIKTILDKRKYKPTYSDREPATQTLIKNGIIEWRHDYLGLILTEYGKSVQENFITEPEKK